MEDYARMLHVSNLVGTKVAVIIDILKYNPIQIYNRKYNPPSIIQQLRDVSLRTPNLECKKMDKLCIIYRVKVVKYSKKLLVASFRQLSCL